MFKESYQVIGVMSGTSLDGVDLAHIHFSIIEGKWHYEILESETVSYDTTWLNNLKIAVDFSDLE
jgi:anhydro-N-acetylmuramic acid kinase